MMSTMSATRRLHEDQRGAVMLIGLGMSCFLIGALWFVMGIGDSIVFRDTMQEAADHGAFTSAVLHAKGMNFIAACNCLMLIAIVIHIVLGMIHDILLLVCILFGVETFGAACEPYVQFRPWYHNYAKGMKIFCDIMHYIEMGAAYGYPFLGAYKGYRVGSDYGDFSGGPQRSLKVIPISTSMIPGQLITAGMNKAIMAISPSRTQLGGGNGKGPTLCNDGTVSNSAGRGTCSGHKGINPDQSKVNSNVDTYTSADAKLGLPVAAAPYNVICKKIGKSAVSEIISIVSGGAAEKAGGWVKSAMGAISGFVGEALAARYCNPLGNNEAMNSFKESFNKGNEAIKGGQDALANAPKDKNGNPLDKNGNIIKSTGPTSGVSGSGGGLSKTIGPISIGSSGGGLDPGFDKWWGKGGPLLPWGGTSNGSPWQQVWAINWKPDYKDSNEHRVAIAQRKFGVEQTAQSSIYFAQAEFYYDCANVWSEESCNGPDIEDNNAGYSVRWRARLRHVTLPDVGTMITSFLGNFLTQMKGYKDLKTTATEDLGKLLTGGAEGVGGVLANSAIEAVFGQVMSRVEATAQNQLNKLGGAVDKGIQGAAAGMGFTPFH
jgi:hypothetical protein